MKVERENRDELLKESTSEKWMGKGSKEKIEEWMASRNEIKEAVSRKGRENTDAAKDTNQHWLS